MAKSKTRPKHKAYKKNQAVKKQNVKNKIKQMKENLQQGPVTFVYHKDKNTVEIPLKDWQVLNQTASRLQDIAMFVATMEQIGRQHIEDGTLLPVYQSDLDFTGNPGEQPKLKDSFWENKSGLGKPTIVKADGVTVYDESAKEEPLIVTPNS